MKQCMKAKILFIIQPQSIIDVITNSSTELFVFNGNDKKVVEELIKEIYPNYREEYYELLALRDVTTEELNDLMNWMTGSSCWPATRSDYEIPGTFTFKELYEPDDRGPAWNGEIQYQLKKNYKGEDSWDYSFVTEENREWVLNKLDPNHTMLLLFSVDENPNYEMQQVLEQIGIRYHLG